MSTHVSRCAIRQGQETAARHALASGGAPAAAAAADLPEPVLSDSSCGGRWAAGCRVQVFRHRRHAAVVTAGTAAAAAGRESGGRPHTARGRAPRGHTAGDISVSSSPPSPLLSGSARSVRSGRKTSGGGGGGFAPTGVPLSLSIHQLPRAVVRRNEPAAASRRDGMDVANTPLLSRTEGGAGAAVASDLGNGSKTASEQPMTQTHPGKNC